MNEKNLFQISLCCSFAGVLLLGIFSYTLDMPLAAIQDITDKDVGDIVFIEGHVEHFSKSLTSSSFSLHDETGSIKVVIFDSNLDLEKESLISVRGTVDRYNGELEIQGKKIILV